MVKTGNVAELGRELIIQQIKLKRISSAGFDNNNRLVTLAQLYASIDSAY
jgi:hypothetical protein